MGISAVVLEVGVLTGKVAGKMILETGAGVPGGRQPPVALFGVQRTQI